MINLEILKKIGISPSTMLIPKKDIDLKKWAVIACDQYTSEPKYWKELEEYIGSSPSSLHLVFPEVYLDDDDKKERINKINSNMEHYINSGIFYEYPSSFILVERETDRKKRYGLLVSLDLEKYDYSSKSKSLIRATEGTIVSRIPPRKEIRKNAALELPHIMILINDIDNLVLGPLIKEKQSYEKLYETELNGNGGKIKGYLINGEETINRIAVSFDYLYSLLDQTNPLLFAMGDGNHSLATAKAHWEELKETLDAKELENHPARFALVEIENIYDEGLIFEPIHRLFSGLTEKNFFSALNENTTSYSVFDIKNKDELIKKVNEQNGKLKLGFSTKNGQKLIIIQNSKKATVAAIIQDLIDRLPQNIKVDYIHGSSTVLNLGDKDGNIALLLPPIYKEAFFSDMISDGPYPRKTFSIGAANEKRYYLEARKIK